VLTHARALLTSAGPEGVTAYVDADYNDTDRVVAEAARTLDLERPVALLCMGVFGYLPDAADAHAVISRVMDRLAPGSYLALWDGTDTSEGIRAGVAAQAEMGSPYQLRTVEEITGWFAGLELVEPGVVPLTQWRPDPVDVGRIDPVDGYGGVARKP
jgi:O-methyltransferase involved in polyketide biosynthesis